MIIRPRLRLILVIACLLILITVLRETGVITLSLYRSSMKSSYSNNWNNMSFWGGDDHVACPPDDTLKNHPDWPCIPKSINEVSLISYIANKTFSDSTDFCSQLPFYVTTNIHGFYWTPLYKNISFSATASCSQALTTRDKTRDYKFCKHYNLTGTITITGSIHVTGFCSYREAKNLILNQLAQTVRDNARAQLQNL